MEYESLYKIKYKFPAEYDSIYQTRFHGEDVIHLDFEINDNPAFICQPSEMWKMIVQIHKEDKNIRAMRQSLPGVALHQFTTRCLVDELVLTNDIEGVNSTRREIHEVIENIERKKTSPRFYGLVMLYSMLGRDDIKLSTCQDIRNIYNDLVLKEVVSENQEDAPDGEIFRKGPVSVTNAAQKEIHRGLCPESNIQTSMQYVLDLIHDDSIDLFVRTGTAHYLMGYIHPFYNGNGRLSRFISSYLLTKELDPLIAYRLSYTIRENLKQYDDAFKLCNDPRNRGDITPFVLWFLEIILEAISKLSAALTERLYDLRAYDEVLKSDPRFSTKQMYPISYLLLQASLFSEHGIPTSDLLSCTDISRGALSSRLKKMEGYGVLKSCRNGREKSYKLDLDQLKGSHLA